MQMPWLDHIKSESEFHRNEKEAFAITSDNVLQHYPSCLSLHLDKTILKPIESYLLFDVSKLFLDSSCTTCTNQDQTCTTCILKSIYKFHIKVHDQVEMARCISFSHTRQVPEPRVRDFKLLETLKTKSKTQPNMLQITQEFAYMLHQHSQYKCRRGAPLLE